MKDRKLATRYARALLSLLPRAEAEAADGFLAAVREAMAESAETRRLLLDPGVPRATRKAMLQSLSVRYGMPVQVANFLAMLVDQNRTRVLPSIAEVFHEEREKAMGIVAAKITTAVPLDGRMLEQARRTLEQVTGRRVELTHSVEPALIGGAVTRVGSMVYDGSLRTQLDKLKGRMGRD